MRGIDPLQVGSGIPIAWIEPERLLELDPCLGPSASLCKHAAQAIVHIGGAGLEPKRSLEFPDGL